MSDGFREVTYCHPFLDEEFTKTYALEELPKAHVDSATFLGARCRLRSDSRAAYFVTFQVRPDKDTFIHMFTKADTYLDLRKRRALPSEVASLPPIGVPWTSWENWSQKKLPIRIWIVTEFLPQILSNIEWEGCSLRLLADLVRAVRSLHESGYVHGDIAPPNIGFRAGGSLALIDLGATSKVEYFPPGEGIKTTAGHLEFMSVVQHDASVPHPADDVESCAYVALWAHTGRMMESPEAKTMWMDADGGDKVEQEIRRVARRARDAPRHEPPPDDMYVMAVRAPESCFLDEDQSSDLEKESSASEGQLSEEI